MWNQIYYTVKRAVQDKNTFISRMLIIIVIILILGSAFGEAFEATSIEKSKVIYVNDDEGEAGKGTRFINQLLEIEDIDELIEFKEGASFEEAKEVVNTGDASAFIYLPKDFTEQINNRNEKKVIQVYSGNDSGIASSVIQNVVDSFLNGMNAALVVHDITGTIDGYEFNVEGSIERKSISGEEKTPSAMSYYAVTMLVLILMFGASYGSEGIAEDYLGVLGDRIKCSPIKPSSQYVGKIIGLVLTSFLQGLVVIIFTSLVFKVNWGNNILLLILILISVSALSTTLGALACIIIKDSIRADGIVSLMIPVFTFIAGGYVKVDLGAIKFISPSYYAQTAFFNTVYNGNMSSTILCLIVMWMCTVVAATLAIISSRRKKN